MSDKLSQVRALMQEENIQAYFLPNNDFHNSEYLGHHDKRMIFISGFKGSNGQIVITQEQALLWTDGRYWLAAPKELYQGWTMMKQGHGNTTYYEWITQNLPSGSAIGFDPALINADAASNRKKYFEEKGYSFKPILRNLINEVWDTRPIMSQEKVFIHEVKYSGATVDEKVKSLYNVLKTTQSQYYFTSVLDEIAWILNLRGKDIDYNPLFFSYLLIKAASDTDYQLSLFINLDKIEGIRDYLSENKIEVFPYEAIGNYLENIEDGIVVDQSELNYSLFLKIKKPLNNSSLISKLKAIKNPREQKGFRESHIRDAVAMAKYFSWLENQLENGADLTEWTAAEQLDKYRAAEDLNQGLSFENISSVGPNAAVIHYAPTAETSSKVVKDQIYLLDSGGQYLDGTIDTTRTLHFGNPTEREKECFTRVLLGNLDIERVTWPQSSRLAGTDFDILARRRLWQIGLDFCHATGHGVGYFLNVHEGPHCLCKGSSEVFELGMNITNEPGYYEEGNFGIRIENVLLIVKNTQIPDYLSFENVTMVPYDKNLLCMRLLDAEDIQYIDAYHEKIWNTLSTILEARNENLALAWLRKATSPING
mmetsp:Transcript_11348/g.11432  ORF Transcript_11348/g.11432 Transcript_11348/m.11432 type:complete len:595 (+) Transcript_11348:6-1790(+)